MLTNGHAWAGYKDPKTDVPTYPLHTGPKRDFEIGGGVGVWDAAGKWIATFRNKEDAEHYVEAGVQRAKDVVAARSLAYDNSKIDTGDQDRTLCRVCLKYFSSSGIGHHTKAKHAMKLGKMLDMRVPTEREYRNHLATKAGSPV
jgi:hypothetical protein